MYPADAEARATATIDSEDEMDAVFAFGHVGSSAVFGFGPNGYDPNITLESGAWGTGYVVGFLGTHGQEQECEGSQRAYFANYGQDGGTVYDFWAAVGMFRLRLNPE